MTLWRECVMIARYAGVSVEAVRWWVERGLELHDGTIVYLERLDTIALHTFVRRAISHPSMRKVRAAVLERAMRNPAEEVQVPRRFQVPPVFDGPGSE